MKTLLRKVGFIKSFFALMISMIGNTAGLGEKQKKAGKRAKILI